MLSANFTLYCCRTMNNYNVLSAVLHVHQISNTCSHTEVSCSAKVRRWRLDDSYKCACPRELGSCNLCPSDSDENRFHFSLTPQPYLYLRVRTFRKPTLFALGYSRSHLASLSLATGVLCAWFDSPVKNDGCKHDITAAWYLSCHILTSLEEVPLQLQKIQELCCQHNFSKHRIVLI